MLLIAVGVMWLTMNAKLSEAHRENTNLQTALVIARTNETTERANAKTYGDGLKVCNASVDAAAAVAQKLSAAGAAAVAQVQQAGKDSTAKALKRIDAAPKNTCGDALNILKGTQ